MGSISEGNESAQDQAVTYRIRWGNAGLAVAGLFALAAALALPLAGEDAPPTPMRADVWADPGASASTPSSTGPTASAELDESKPTKPRRKRRREQINRSRRRHAERRPRRRSPPPAVVPPAPATPTPTPKTTGAVEREFGL